MKKWLTIAAKIAPIVLIGIPGVPVLLVPLIVEAIQTVQQIPGADGSQKKRLVLQAATNGITAFNASKGHQAIDPTIVTTILDPALDTTIGVIKAVEQAHNTLPSQPTAP